MAKESRYFGRYYKLTISLPEGEPYVIETQPGKPAMDIKFDVAYARGQTAREGTVSILGLGRERINTFLELAGMTRGKAMSELVGVKLEAGYFSDAGTVDIINGFAWYATVTSPPQMWLNINVSEYNPLGGKAVRIGTVLGDSVGEVADQILAAFSDSSNSEGEDSPGGESSEGGDDGTGEGVGFYLEDKTQEGILYEDKQCSLMFNTKQTIKSAIAEMNKSLSDKIQFILRTPGSEDEMRCVEALDKDADKVVDCDPVKIDKDLGLLSVTGITAVSGCITTFIDGGCPDELTHLELESWLNPQANGTYYILKKQYVGHYMGQEWYVKYFCSDRKNEKEEET